MDDNQTVEKISNMKDRGKNKNKQQQQKTNFWKNQKLFHEGYGNMFLKKLTTQERQVNTKSLK